MARADASKHIVEAARDVALFMVGFMAVLLGAIAAFALLNIIAVVFSAAAAQWLPDTVVTAAVGILFLLFGIYALRDTEAQGDELPDTRAHVACSSVPCC